MNDCVLDENARCLACGRRASRVGVRRNCNKGGARGGPGLLQKAANFVTSAAKHVAAGMPQASDEEVARRFAICRTCEHFDGMACNKCGCHILREQHFVSKLSWANEKCPAGKWGHVSG